MARISRCLLLALLCVTAVLATEPNTVAGRIAKLKAAEKAAGTSSVASKSPVTKPVTTKVSAPALEQKPTAETTTKVDETSPDNTVVEQQSPETVPKEKVDNTVAVEKAGPQEVVDQKPEVTAEMKAGPKKLSAAAEKVVGLVAGVDDTIEATRGTRSAIYRYSGAASCVRGGIATMQWFDGCLRDYFWSVVNVLSRQAVDDMRDATVAMIRLSVKGRPEEEKTAIIAAADRLRVNSDYVRSLVTALHNIDQRVVADALAVMPGDSGIPVKVKTFLNGHPERQKAITEFENLLISKDELIHADVEFLRDHGIIFPATWSIFGYPGQNAAPNTQEEVNEVVPNAEVNPEEKVV